MSAVLLLTVGLWNAELELSEKGFYAMAFALSLFGAVTVQKNVRDLALLAPEERFESESKHEVQLSNTVEDDHQP